MFFCKLKPWIIQHLIKASEFMAEHNDIGIKGEEIAVMHLLSKSYYILEKNWRYGRLEVDIIARQKDELVIVEVKTRTGNFLASPGETVDKRKQKMLIRAANAYISKTKMNLDVRFDIITVNFSNKTKYQVYHIEDAFYPHVRS